MTPVLVRSCPLSTQSPTGLSSPAATRPAELLRQQLQQRADKEGLFLGNLIGHLLEVATG